MREMKINRSFTVRTDTIDRYLRDVNALSMVTPDEEAELALKAQEGDEAAFNRLVEANLRFVISIAKAFQGSGMELCDLINEGNMGLMKAIRKFDPSRGFKLISYSVWWIRQSIMAAISEQGRMVRLPYNQVSNLSKLVKASARFEQEMEREPTDAELAELTGIEVEKIGETLAHGWRHSSLDKKLDDDPDSGTLADITPDTAEPAPDSAVNDESLHEDLLRAFGILTTREADILRSAFGIGCPEMTLEEIGEKMDLTRERVRQIRERAVRKLARPEVRSVLRQYL